MQGKFVKDYAAAHEALSKLGTQLPVTTYGGGATAPSSFGSFDTYSTQEVRTHACIVIGHQYIETVLKQH